MNILSIYSYRLIKFEIVVKDIFDLFEPFWTRKLWDKFRSNFQRTIITILPICTQRLPKFEIVVWYIFDFFELIWTQNFLNWFGLTNACPLPIESQRFI